MKLIINKCYGGFGLSLEAINLTYELQGKKLYFFTTDGYGDETEYTPTSLEAVIDNEDSYYSVSTYTSSTPSEESFVSGYMIDRDNPYAVQAVEQLGNRANGQCAQLQVVNLPDGCEYSIREYDGQEWIEETWFSVTKEQLIEGLSPELVESISEVSCIRLAKTEV